MLGGGGGSGKLPTSMYSFVREPQGAKKKTLEAEMEGGKPMP